MRKLKKVLFSSPTIRKVDYECGRPVIVVTIDTSPTGIGWAVRQDDEEQRRYVVRFGAKVLNARQRNYPQVKRELWGVVTSLKCDKEYFIGASVTVEIDCLPLLGMITSFSTPDIAMLRWIAYIKSLNPEFEHIAGKENAVADMLSRARYENEEEMVTEGDEVGTKLHSSSHAKGDHMYLSNALESFLEESYEGDWLLIGQYLSTLSRHEGWSDEEFKRIRRKAYGYFLKNGFLWKHPKKRDGILLRIVCDKETQMKLMQEFHESLWVGHRGVWAIFAKPKERYWWKGMYKDVAQFVESCVTCQMYSNVRHRDGLHPTYPLAMHYKWVVDIVTMPLGLWQMRKRVLACSTTCVEWKDAHTQAMRKLKKVLFSSPTIRKVDYECGRPVIVVTIDTSPTGIGWAVRQDDEEQRRYVVRFGAKVLNARQRNYPQVKRELWGVVTSLKCDKEYFIGASVTVEIDCLPLLGMITSFSTPDIAMLRWIAYIKSLNPEFEHIAGKENAVADMLSRARYENEEEMVTEGDEVGTKLHSSSHAKGDHMYLSNALESFLEESYEGDWLLIGQYLSTLSRHEGWSDEEFKRIRRKAYGYFLKNGFLWKHPKKRDGILLRIVCDKETQMKLMQEFHESLWVGHRGVWAIFAKPKERYWWKAPTGKKVTCANNASYPINGVGTLENGLFVLDRYEKQIQVCNAKTKTQAMQDAELWHARFGDVGYGSLMTLQRHNMVHDLSFLDMPPRHVCEGCVLGKMHRFAFSQDGSIRETRKLQLVHSDVCGPMRMPSMGNNLYFVTFIDDFSRFCWVYPLKAKSDVFAIFQHYVAMFENETGCKVQTLRTDRGGEYMSGASKDFLEKKGIKHQCTMPYTPQQNGVAERKNSGDG
ncbi:hypothetical protein L7F22_055264 [Adiantum nelumboides]|nr:hypothetical protein [Adiantum nelumboides]